MLLADTADSDLIEQCLGNPAVCGFTTNPTLMARAAHLDMLGIADYVMRAKTLCRLLGRFKDGRIRHVMLQLVGSQEQMLEQAAIYREEVRPLSSTRLWLKIPPTPVGISCCPMLKNGGSATLVTAVFTGRQALVALESGAEGVAVYLGRMKRLDEQWERQIERIARLVRDAGKLLLIASFPDPEAVEQALEYSFDLTVPPDILSRLLDDRHSADAMQTFNSKVTGIL